MPTIVATPGSSTANSYVTIAQADTYFGDKLKEAAWKAHGNSTREQALIQATAEIEGLGGARLVDLSPARELFEGEPYLTYSDSGGTFVQDQALHFPRKTDIDANASKFIPPRIRDAVCEQAIWLLHHIANPPLVDHAELQSEGVRSISVDGLSLAYTGTRRPAHIAPLAWDFMRVFVRQGFPTRV